MLWIKDKMFLESDHTRKKAMAIGKNNRSADENSNFISESSRNDDVTIVYSI
jgi:hypothetical protein